MAGIRRVDTLAEVGVRGPGDESRVAGIGAVPQSVVVLGSAVASIVPRVRTARVRTVRGAAGSVGWVGPLWGAAVASVDRTGGARHAADTSDRAVRDGTHAAYSR